MPNDQSISVNARIDDAQFRRYFSNRRDEFRDMMKKGLERIGDAGEGIMMKKVPKDRGGSGGMMANVSAQMKGRSQISIAPRMDSEYPIVMITGANGWSIDNPPPWTPIARWARRHRIPAGPVWMNIIQEGIPSADQSEHRVDYQQETLDELEERSPKIMEDQVQKWIKGAV